MGLDKNRKGYTLIELMVVVAIIGILGAIAIPGYIGYRLRAERSVAWTDLQALRLLEEQFYAEINAYTGPLNNTADFAAALPAFQPDPSSMYTYTVANGATGDTQSFVARAQSIGGRDPGPDWTITEANVRNFCMHAVIKCI